MKSAEIRQKYLDYFRQKSHKIIPSASLMPENDATTLFTGSGMQPLVQYFLGEKHPLGMRLANSQKCFRAEDIEEVGDNRHTTFFEMLGNWSLGDYWKEEQLSWCYEFLTKEIGLPVKKLYVTCFAGDEKNALPRDSESAEIWKKIFMKAGFSESEVEARIYFYGSEKNWWSRSGMPETMPTGEPGGPDSEVFYKFENVSHDPKYGDECHPNCDCGRFLEIGNSVFMQYKKTVEGSFETLPKKNVDFGGGLERIVVASNNDSDIFKIDSFAKIIEKLECLSGKSYEDTTYKKSFRIIADHVKAAVFLMADGVLPSNTDQGYFVRRLIRRAVRHIDLLNFNDVNDGRFASIIEEVAEIYKGSFPELINNSERIASELKNEIGRFRKTLASGLREFERVSAKGVSGKDAFMLFSTHGFPIDLSVELARERGVPVDVSSFESEFKRHQEISRRGADKKFKGGLADHSVKVVKYHTATHLLHQALRDVLGKHVEQRGSNITEERLRFDFSHQQKLTDEEKKKVETIVNDKIREARPVNKIVVPRAEAEKSGALHFFGEKYGDEVSIYYIGDTFDDAYSKEFCGGPHVSNTGEIGNFKIQKEEAISAGVRRIKAILI